MRAVLILLLCAVAANANAPRIYDTGTHYIPRYHQEYVNVVIRHLRNRYGLIVHPPGYYHRFGRSLPGVAVGSTTVRSTVLPAGRTIFRSFRGSLDGGPGPTYEDVFDSGPEGVSSVTEITRGPTRRFSLPASVYETTTRGSLGGPQVADFSTTYGDISVPYTEGDIAGDGGIDIDGNGGYVFGRGSRGYVEGSPRGGYVVDSGARGRGGYVDVTGPAGYVESSGPGGYVESSGPGGYVLGSEPVNYNKYYRDDTIVPYGPVTLAAGSDGRGGITTTYGSLDPYVLRGGVDAGSSAFSTASTVSSSGGRRVPSAFDKLKRDYDTYKKSQD